MGGKNYFFLSKPNISEGVKTQIFLSLDSKLDEIAKLTWECELVKLSIFFQFHINLKILNLLLNIEKIIKQA